MDVLEIVVDEQLEKRERTYRLGGEQMLLGKCSERLGSLQGACRG